MQETAQYLLEMQTVRFLIAGGISTVLYYMIFAPLTWWGKPHYLMCAVCAFLPSFALNFLLQKFWAFESTSIETANKELILFTLKNIAFFGFNTLLLDLFVRYVRLTPLYGQIATTVVLTPPAYYVYGVIFAR